MMCASGTPVADGGSPARRDLLDAILARELAMFQAVNNRGGTSTCQERPRTFRLMRRMLFSVMPDEYLASYLDDLKAAGNNGRNFMVEKYARMDGLIPPVTGDMDTVAGITGIEEKWVADLSAAFPATFPPNQGMFGRYLSAELETLSVRTLGLWEQRVKDALDRGENLARLRYENMAREAGLPSLEEREAGGPL